MKHVLVTGANGFVGKVLLGQLLAAGYRVSCACTAPNPIPREGVSRPYWISVIQVPVRRRLNG
ncbi:NAD-dependent epimerase/dehydratase family protein [Pseudomonas sp. H2_H03]